MNDVNLLLSGGIIVGSLLVGLFFLRFWRQAGDRLFLYFALSFFIEAGNRAGLALLPGASEAEPLFYGLRVVAYGLIMLAIWQKNRPR